MNLVVIKGRLTRYVETRYTQSVEPKAYCMFSLAVNRMKQGECDFINCKAWGKTAEFLQRYFKKGQEVLAKGRIEVTSQEVDGIKKTFTNVVVEQVEFCGSKSDSSTSTVNNDEDDLPF